MSVRNHTKLFIEIRRNTLKKEDQTKDLSGDQLLKDQTKGICLHPLDKDVIALDLMKEEIKTHSKKVERYANLRSQLVFVNASFEFDASQKQQSLEKELEQISIEIKSFTAKSINKIIKLEKNHIHE